MIKSLVLRNFMRHENLDVAFGPGLQVIRGANEGGKSSTLLGIAYALFGSKVLRTTFSDAVTWGKPESSLKVVLGLTVNGRDITVTRSKGGAEVIEGGRPIVTGQSEVSNYMSSLIGADAQAAARLMLSNQGNLRGSLEQGPKATAQMIEGLADFDLFERLIEAMTTKLVIGSTDQAEALVQMAATIVEGLPVPVAPNLENTDHTLAVLAAKRDGAEIMSANLFKDLQRAETQLSVMNARINTADDLRRRLAETDVTKQLLEKQASDLAAEIQCDVTDEAIAAQREAIAAAKKWREVSRAFKEFSTLVYPDQFWDDTRATFDVARKEATALVKEIEGNVAEITSDIKVLRGTLVTSAFCGYCGEDFSKVPSVALKNAETQAGIDRMVGALESIRKDLDEARKAQSALDALDRVANDFNAKARTLNGYVQFNEGFWPPKLTWLGPELPSEEPDLQALSTALSYMEGKVKAADAAKAKLGLLEAQIASQGLNIRGLERDLSAYADATPEALDTAEAAKSAAHSAWSASYSVFSESSIAFADLTREREKAVTDYEAALKERQTAEANLKSLTERLDDMRFNNALLKKVRAARPIISDKLWNTVLSAVSTMFSRMRGETSVVSKGKDGFTVNGQPVESLSGSTLDLLGLAIRTALIKTFIPHCPFLILDEPGAAMDEDRVTAMLGFVHATGFSQVILVTHDSIAETVADNVVQL